MYPILPLVPFWALGSAGVYPKLPGWYLEAYSNEDRMKQIAERQGITDAWQVLALNKINELAAANNEQQAVINDLKARVSALEAKA